MIEPLVYTGGMAQTNGYLFEAPEGWVLVDAPEGPFSTNLFWNRAIEAGRAYGVVHQGLWFDVGTPGAIGMTEAVLADG